MTGRDFVQRGVSFIGGNLPRRSRTQQLPEKFIAQFPRRGLYTHVLSGGVCGNISAAGVKLELVLARQTGDKFLVRVRLRPTQLVVEVNYREDNPEFLVEFEQKAQQRNRIHAARNRHTDAVPGFEQLLPPDVIPDVLREVVHGNIVQLWGR